VGVAVGVWSEGREGREGLEAKKLKTQKRERGRHDPPSYRQSNMNSCTASSIRTRATAEGIYKPRLMIDGIHDESEALGKYLGLPAATISDHILSYPPMDPAVLTRAYRWACAKWGGEPSELHNRPVKGVTSGHCFRDAQAVWEAGLGDPVLVMEMTVLGGHYVTFALHGCNVDSKKKELFDIANYVSKGAHTRYVWIVAKPKQTRKWLVKRDNTMTDLYPHNTLIMWDGKMYNVVHHQRRIGEPDYEDLGHTVTEA
jgi:hypothetical protein